MLYFIPNPSKRIFNCFGCFKNFTAKKNIGLLIMVFVLAFAGCKSDSTETDPIIDIDTDGDGILDADEVLNGTNKNNPCDPKPASGYSGYDRNNTIWLGADCDVDGMTNAQELENNTNPFVEDVVIDDAVYAKAEFLPTLSEVQLFKGNPFELVVNSTTTEYSLITPLYSDYAHKFRTISLPEGSQMTYNGEGLLEFPDNTVISKTFYYFKDERDPSLGKKLIETRLLIKKEGVWNLGNYLWNDEQNEAFLGTAGPTVPVQWVDMSGIDRSADYQVPNAFACVQCHNKSDTTIPIGPKARNLNFTFNGKNQLQNFVDLGLLTDAPEMAQIEATPDWTDMSFSLEERTRAYMDINCAHCHQPGGQHDASIADRPDFRYEIPFEASHIADFKEDIKNRVGTAPGFGTYSMPQLGTNQLHSEGVALIQAYIDSLE